MVLSCFTLTVLCLHPYIKYFIILIIDVETEAEGGYVPRSEALAW